MFKRCTILRIIFMINERRVKKLIVFWVIGTICFCFVSYFVLMADSWAGFEIVDHPILKLIWVGLLILVTFGVMYIMVNIFDLAKYISLFKKKPENGEE